MEAKIQQEPRLSELLLLKAPATGAGAAFAITTASFVNTTNTKA